MLDILSKPGCSSPESLFSGFYFWNIKIFSFDFFLITDFYFSFHSNCGCSRRQLSPRTGVHKISLFGIPHCESNDDLYVYNFMSRIETSRRLLNIRSQTNHYMSIDKKPVMWHGFYHKPRLEAT